MRADCFLLFSSDGHLVEAPISLQQDSEFLKNLHDAFGNLVSEAAIQLTETDASTLKLIIEWHNQRRDSILGEWDRTQPFNTETVLRLVSAANFLDIEPLLQWSCRQAAGLINENTSVSFSRFPDEIKLLIAPHLTPYTLYHAVNTGNLPLTPDIERRARHAHVWSTCLSNDSFSYLDKVFADDGNAILFGRDVQHIYNSYPQKSACEQHVLFTWLGNAEQKLEFNPHVVSQERIMRFGQKTYSPVQFDSGVTLTIQDPTLPTEFTPDELQQFVSKEELQTTVLYFKGDCSLHYAPLRFDQKLIWGSQYEYVVSIDGSYIYHNLHKKTWTNIAYGIIRTGKSMYWIRRADRSLI